MKVTFTKIAARFVGVIILLLPFIGVPSEWKESALFILGIILIIASFGKSEKQIEVVEVAQTKVVEDQEEETSSVLDTETKTNETESAKTI